MKVKFKYGWFGPNAFLYEKGEQEVPDEFYDVLPSSAKLVGSEKKEFVDAVKPVTLKDFDDERANSDATVALLEKFEKEDKKKGK